MENAVAETLFRAARTEHRPDGVYRAAEDQKS